jgi:hypothetical protein
LVLPRPPADGNGGDDDDAADADDPDDDNGDDDEARRSVDNQTGGAKASGRAHAARAMLPWLLKKEAPPRASKTRARASKFTLRLKEPCT